MKTILGVLAAAILALATSGGVRADGPPPGPGQTALNWQPVKYQLPHGVTPGTVAAGILYADAHRKFAINKWNPNAPKSSPR